MGRADVYVQPKAADPVLPAEVVLAIARHHVPSVGEVTGVDESGGEARAYLVDDTVVVKTQRPHRLRPRTSLAKEAHLLGALAPVLHGRIPRLLGYGRLETAHGPVEYICMTRMPGVAARHVTLEPAARQTILGELGRLLRTLHGMPVASDLVPFDVDVDALRRRLEYGFDDVADALAEHGAVWPLRDGVDAIAARALAALPATFDPVVLHSNPSPTHVFVDPDTHGFRGVIDFGDSYASHPALDLHRWPDPADRIALRAAYLDGVPVPDDFDLMWTIAMIYTDAAVIANGSPYAEKAAADLATRLANL